MKLKKLLFIVFALTIFSTPALAANTVQYSFPVINISAIDSDWNDTESRRVQYIIFVPGSANDILVIKQASATGPEIARMKSADGEPRIAIVGGSEIDMFLDYSDCTLNAGSKVIILLFKSD